MDKKFAVKFVGYWIVNSVILGLANAFFPANFVLGNAFLNVPVAAVFSGFLLTVLLSMAKGLARTMKHSKNSRIIMFAFYWGAASFGVWIVARIALISGFGISNFAWAIVAGMIVSFANWLMRQAYKGMELI